MKTLCAFKFENLIIFQYANVKKIYDNTQNVQKTRYVVMYLIY